jgi:hypothetical protein
MFWSRRMIRRLQTSHKKNRKEARMASTRWEEVAEDYNRIFRKDAYYCDILDMIAARVEAGEGSRILDPTFPTHHRVSRRNF